MTHEMTHTITHTITHTRTRLHVPDTQVAANLVTHLERTGTIGTAATATATKKPSPIDKDISGMGSTALGLMVLFLASVMVLTRDAFHGVVRLALTVFGGPRFDPESLSWEAIYGDLLRKIGKHPDGGSPLSAAAIGAAKGGGGGSSGGSSGGGGGGDRRLRERGRSATRDDDEEATRSLLADGDGGGRAVVVGGRGVLEMTATNSGSRSA